MYNNIPNIYLYVWGIDNFIIKGDFLFVKIFLTKLLCYHDNYFKYFIFGKYHGFVSKARGFFMRVFSSCSC